eukprot:CAMPEP_0177259630 /NCGR_PEP_ID=MMETSP0367-20130122/58754_1 /TAXON_ID=447022 ORGANISM="Scrippsiella hangoei-like, Strain SHHI-4" /NCGR_SAMPLE_ID=MMETSP0367 /ASSEMBLY_ACC=CAM_ASM_000362 /LENGTH=325 /DNA_ID=CAMNT_0018713947 /DNA_START=38 /DNA_END=1012 /DNA_ORIENTATION=+
MTYIVEKKEDARTVPEEDENGEPVFDQNPVKVTCAFCGRDTITFIEYESSWVTYAVCIVLLFVLNWAALCVVPVVYPLFKDVVHHCPRCLSVLATRSRVAISSFKQEVMSLRFGSCVVVLARKYVIGLSAILLVIAGFNMMRNSGAASTDIEVWARGPDVSSSWQDFLRDCGFKSYLGNPIHVSVAFNEKFKNQTVSWEGQVHHVEDSLSFLWLNQRGAIFTHMDPQQFPQKRDMADLVLLFNDGDAVAKAAGKLARGQRFAFEATFVEVGKRGAPHVLALWEVRPLKDASSNSSLGGGEVLDLASVTLASPGGQNLGPCIGDAS